LDVYPSSLESSVSPCHATPAHPFLTASFREPPPFFLKVPRRRISSCKLFFQPSLGPAKTFFSFSLLFFPRQVNDGQVLFQKPTLSSLIFLSNPFSLQSPTLLVASLLFHILRSASNSPCDYKFELLNRRRGSRSSDCLFHSKASRISSLPLPGYALRFHSFSKDVERSLPFSPLLRPPPL